MKLDDKATVRAAQRLIRKSPAIARISTVLRFIVEELEINDIRGNFIYLTPDKLDVIEKHFNKMLGVPILSLSLDIDNRLDTSKVVGNEKWATGGVFDIMLCMGGNTKMPIIGSEIYPTPGMVVSVRYEQFDIGAIKKLLVVENGELITNWDRVVGHLPADYNDAILLFKGYGKNQQYLREILASIGNDVPVGLFFDHDAAGVDMALSLAGIRSIDLVVPKLLNESVLSKSKADEYNAQFSQMMRMLEDPKTPDKIVSLLNELKAGGLAITQEHLITHNACLDIIQNVRINND